MHNFLGYDLHFPPFRFDEIHEKNPSSRKNLQKLHLHHVVHTKDQSKSRFSIQLKIPIKKSLQSSESLTQRGQTTHYRRVRGKLLAAPRKTALFI